MALSVEEKKVRTEYLALIQSLVPDPITGEQLTLEDLTSFIDMREEEQRVVLKEFAAKQKTSKEEAIVSIDEKKSSLEEDIVDYETVIGVEPVLK